MHFFLEISTFLTLSDVLICRSVSKRLAADVADLPRICIGPSVHKFKPIVALFVNLKIIIIENRQSFFPDFFEGVDLSALNLSKICLAHIHVLSSAWASPTLSLLLPTVSYFEGKDIGGGCSSNSLMNLLLCFPNLRSIRLDGCFSLEDVHLSRVSEQLPLLNDIAVSKSSQLRNAQIISSNMNAKYLILTKCPVLSKITVPESLVSCVLKATAISDEAVEALVRTCVSLLLLDISHCHSLEYTAISSCTLSILKVDYCSSLVSLSVDGPLLRSIDFEGCSSLVQLVLRSECLNSIDLTMSRALKSVELRCPYLMSFIVCGCENLKYYGRYLKEDYKGISLDKILSACPSLRLGDGSCLAGSPLYADYTQLKVSSSSMN